MRDKKKPTHSVTYPKGLGAAVQAPGVGTIQPGATKDVTLSPELALEYSDPSCVFEVTELVTKQAAKKTVKE